MGCMCALFERQHVCISRLASHDQCSILLKHAETQVSLIQEYDIIMHETEFPRFFRKYILLFQSFGKYIPLHKRPHILIDTLVSRLTRRQFTRNHYGICYFHIAFVVLGCHYTKPPLSKSVKTFLEKTKQSNKTNVIAKY